MTKKAKNFLIAFVVAVIFFIISLIVQYYFSVGIAIKAMIAIAMVNGMFGLLMTIGIIYIKPDKENKGKFSVDIFILKFILSLLVISYMIMLSTLGNLICEYVCVICFFVLFFLAMIDILYLSIKTTIEAYKKYKEKE